MICHLGFREKVAKSTLADANEQRDWRLWEDLAKGLMRKARVLYAGEDLGLELENTVYALDYLVWASLRAAFGRCSPDGLIHNHRSLSDFLPLGRLSHLGRDQDARPTRSDGPHSDLHSHHRCWQSRCSLA